MKVTVCIGSYCHVKGSRYIIERLHQLVEEKGLKAEFVGSSELILNSNKVISRIKSLEEEAI